MLLHLLFLLSQAASAIAAEPVSVEEYLSLKSLHGVDVSPDGRVAAFSVSGADPGDDRYRTTLYIWEAGAGAQPLAAGFLDVRTPRWSRGGTWLAFISAGPDAEIDAPPQIWVAPVFGDDPIHLGELPGAVVDYGWASDTSIYALARDAAEGTLGFWQISVPGGETERIWGGDPGMREMAVSPNGGSIAYSTNGTGSPDDFLDYDIWLLDVALKEVRRLTTRPGPDAAPLWSPDGAAIVFRAPQSTQLTRSQTELFRVSSSGGRPQILTGAFDRSVIDHRWPAGGDLLFTAALGTYTHVFAWRVDGAVVQVLGGAYNYGPFDARGAGTTLYTVRQSATQPPELWRINSAQEERLTALNARAEKWELGRQAVMQWIAPDGQAIEGLLIYPVGYQEGRSYPLLVNPGGGPGARVRNVIAEPCGYQLFAAAGYAVLAANVRGSGGYGETFLNSERHDLAGGELVDLMAGVDRAIELGIADPARLAVFGNGYSGYVTTGIITRTQRFKAAVASFGSGPPDPLAGRDGFAADDSARQHASDVRTPLLIIERTDRTPQADAEFFFRRLRWFDRYLKFDGADLFDFYLIGEWVPGPGGWQMHVSGVDLRAAYDTIVPASGRYLEITLDFRPDEGAGRRARGLEVDPARGVSLSRPDGVQRPPAGVVTELFGRPTLASDSASVFNVPAPRQGAPAALRLTLAFEVSPEPAEYRLRVAGFAPVRIWVGRNE